MKVVAFTAIVALVVSLPFLLRRRRLARVGVNRHAHKLQKELYDNEDFFFT